MAGANVRTTASLSDVRNALIQFHERAGGALASIRQESLRTLRWLQDEQPQYWQSELRRGFDRVASARVSYETCRMRTVAGHRSACIEEKVALQRAQRRLEYVQQQIEVTRRWAQKAADEANEFFGRLGPLEHALEDDLPRMVASLERMLDAIEDYDSTSRQDAESTSDNASAEAKSNSREPPDIEANDMPTHEAFPRNNDPTA